MATDYPKQQLAIIVCVVDMDNWLLQTDQKAG